MLAVYAAEPFDYKKVRYATVDIEDLKQYANDLDALRVAAEETQEDEMKSPPPPVVPGPAKVSQQSTFQRHKLCDLPCRTEHLGHLTPGRYISPSSACCR